MTQPYDLVILGTGPGGYGAAIEAATSGLRTAVVEAAEIGGTCLNRGCIPTKFWLGATAPIDELAAQKKAHAAAGEIRMDFAGLQARRDRIIAATRKAMLKRLEALGVAVALGRGRLTGEGKIEVAGTPESTMLEYRNLVAATGSHPSSFPGLEPDGKRVLDSTGFLGIPEMPHRLIIVGGGFIGLEMAQAAHRLGAKITVLDVLPRLAGAEDAETAKALEATFRRMGWDIRLGVKVASVVTRGEEAVLTLEGGEKITADVALVAVGRRPSSADLGLETTGAKLDRRGTLKTDENLLAAPHVYAVGDVNGIMPLAHAAAHQARYVVRRILGQERGPYVSGPVPSIIYGAPEVMRVGCMVAEAKAAGESVLVSRAPLAANPIAQAHAATQGFVKCVWRQGKLVGVTAVGADVSRFVTAASLMIRAGWTRDDAEGFMFPHPTLDEALKAALLADKEAV